MAFTRRQALAALLGAAAAGAAGGLAGCSRDRYLTDEGVLSLWYWDRSISDTLLARVPEETGIALQPQKVPSDFKAKLLTSLAGKAYVPDITGFNDDIATYFPDADQFVDLYELGAGEVEDQYLDWKWNLGRTPEGKLVGFPMDTGPTAMFYRHDIFEEAGLPTDPAELAARADSWERYFDLGEELKANVEGSFLFANPVDVFNQAVAQLPQRWMTAEGEFIGDGDHIRVAWDIAIQSHERGLTARTPAGTDWDAGVTTGRIASLVDAVWRAKIISDTAKNTSGLWMVTDAPGGAGNIGGSFLGITQSCRDPEAAWEVIKWVQSPANQLFAYNDIQLFPAARDALTSEEVLEENEFYSGQVINEVFIEAARNVQPVFMGPYDNLISPRFTDEITNVWTAGKDPDRAWRDALEQVERHLRHRGVI